LLDMRGTVWAEGVGQRGLHEPGGRREIDGALLMGLLADSLPPPLIQRDKAVTSVKLLSSGEQAVVFSDGTSAEFDLVIGADGAWSKTRELFKSAAPVYSGVTMIEVHISDLDTRNRDIGGLVGRGFLLAYGDNSAIIAQRHSSGVRVHFSFRCGETWAKDSGIDWTSVDAARAGIKHVFVNWDKTLLSLVDACDDVGGVFVRPLYHLPPHRFQRIHKPGITLIGDAAHLLTPFADQGAKLAMADGTDLAEAIVEAFEQPDVSNTAKALDGAILAYEQKMFRRTRAAMQSTVGSMNALVTPDAAQRGLKLLVESGQVPRGVFPDF